MQKPWFPFFVSLSYLSAYSAYLRDQNLSQRVSSLLSFRGLLFISLVLISIADSSLCAYLKVSRNDTLLHTAINFIQSGKAYSSIFNKASHLQMGDLHEQHCWFHIPKSRTSERAGKRFCILYWHRSQRLSASPKSTAWAPPVSSQIKGTILGESPTAWKTFTWKAAELHLWNRGYYLGT